MIGTGLAASSPPGGRVIEWGRSSGLSGEVSRAPLPASGAPRSRRVAVGGAVLALTADGAVWTWGKSNSRGQLGRPSDDPVADRIPAPVPGIVGATDVSAGGLHSLAMGADGGVWTWGWSLQPDDQSGSYVPQRVVGLPQAVGVAAGFDHSLALASDGTVWAWGQNAHGQLGDGSDADRFSPVQVPDLTEVIAVSAGFLRSAAVRSDGTVYEWGMLQPMESDERAPRLVEGPPSTTAIALGLDFTLALAADGAVWAWGENCEWDEWPYPGCVYDFDQLGRGFKESSTVPVRVINLPPVVAIATGYHHSLALDSEGNAWAWGDDSGGQLGSCSLQDLHCSTGPPPARVKTPPLQSVAAWGDESVGITAR